jgi:hypothetical protein
MMVMMIAITPSLNASNRPLFISLSIADPGDRSEEQQLQSYQPT